MAIQAVLKLKVLLNLIIKSHSFSFNDLNLSYMVGILPDGLNWHIYIADLATSVFPAKSKPEPKDVNVARSSHPNHLQKIFREI